MKVSRKIRSGEQLMLLPEFSGPVFRTMAEKRVYFGSVAELIAMRVLNAQQMQIDGRCEICPDLAIFRQGLLKGYAEVKSCGRTNQFIVYKWRHDKEKEFEAHSGKFWFYVVVSHSVRAEDAADFPALIREFAKTPVTIKLMTLTNLSEIIFKMGPEKVLNKRYDRNHGSSRTGYVGGGWRVRFKDVPVIHSALKFFEIEGVEIGVTLQVSSIDASTCLPFNIFT